MEHSAPASFLELLGGILIIFAVIVSLLSLMKCVRAHAVRVLAIFSVAGLALFANQTWTYFVAIFVIATAITELDFLQNLAAIVRGNKEYFDYKKETLSREAQISKVAQDVVEASVVSERAAELQTPDGNDLEGGSAADSNCEPDSELAGDTKKPVESPSPIDGKPPSDEAGSANAPYHQTDTKGPAESGLAKSKRTLRSIYHLENKALDRLQSLYSAVIERGQRFAGAGRRLEVDGVIAGEGKLRDIIFEVKYAVNQKSFIAWINYLSQRISQMDESYKLITGREAQFVLVLILEESMSLTMRQMSVLRDKFGTNFFMFTADELALSEKSQL